MLGSKGARDLESINMISDDNFLVKFRASEFSGKKDYWTIIDKLGMIQSIPKLIKPFLTWNSFSNGASRLTEHGCVLSFKGGKKGVLSLYTDSKIDDKRIISVEFNRGGEVSRAKSYESCDYEENVKEQLLKDLIAKAAQFANDPKAFDEEAATQCAQTLTFSQDVIRSREGKLYRVATVHHKMLKREVTIDPSSHNDDIKDQMKTD